LTKQPIDLAYKEAGKGIPLVLLHGFPLNRTIWKEVKPILAQEARLILPDLRGHGESACGEATTTMEEMAADVAALLDKLEVERVAMGGHSMGGYVALAFARLYPHRLLGLALVGSHPLADSAEKAAGRMLSADRIEREGLKFLAEDMPEKLTVNPQFYEPLREIILKNSPAGAAAAQRGMASRSDERRTLTGLNVPAAMICGDRDPFVSMSIAVQTAEDMRLGNLTMVPGAAHMPMIEDPEPCARALLDMLAAIQK